MYNASFGWVGGSFLNPSIYPRLNTSVSLLSMGCSLLPILFSYKLCYLLVYPLYGTPYYVIPYPGRTYVHVLGIHSQYLSNMLLPLRTPSVVHARPLTVKAILSMRHTVGKVSCESHMR